MRCIRCGAENSKDSIYCISCGGAIPQQAAQSNIVDGLSISERFRSARQTALIAVILLSLSFGLYICYMEGTFGVMTDSNPFDPDSSIFWQDFSYASSCVEFIAYIMMIIALLIMIQALTMDYRDCAIKISLSRRTLVKVKYPLIVALVFILFALAMEIGDWISTPTSWDLTFAIWRAEWYAFYIAEILTAGILLIVANELYIQSESPQI